MTETEMHELADSRARAIMSDIEGDNPDKDLDYGYEVYVGEIPPSIQDQFGADIMGCVYAGELGIWFFLPNATGDGLDAVWLSSRDELNGMTFPELIFPRIFGKDGVYAGTVT